MRRRMHLPPQLYSNGLAGDVLLRVVGLRLRVPGDIMDFLADNISGGVDCCAD